MCRATYQTRTIPSLALQHRQQARHQLRLLPRGVEAPRRKHGLEHLHEVELLEISPSEELNVLAQEYYEELPRPLARYIKPDSSGTLLSLILFEQGFCSKLYQLGLADALEKEAEIRRFFRL